MSYVISVTGSVAVGKSTVAKQIRDILINSADHPTVDLVSTDGFLYSAQELNSRGLMKKKGFPESYDESTLKQFLLDCRKGTSDLSVPVYSHIIYDLTEEVQTIQSPDILVIEGVNAQILTDKTFVDYSIYIDASVELIETWYLERFKRFREEAINHPDSFFYKYTLMPESKAMEIARQTWKTINEVNLIENILPFKSGADLIFEKGEGHVITG